MIFFFFNLETSRMDNIFEVNLQIIVVFTIVILIILDTYKLLQLLDDKAVVCNILRINFLTITFYLLRIF